jgi:hypothetical protein
MMSTWSARSRPDDDAADVPYEVTASGDYTDYEQIRDIVRTHLAR